MYARVQIEPPIRKFDFWIGLRKGKFVEQLSELAIAQAFLFLLSNILPRFKIIPKGNSTNSISLTRLASFSFVFWVTLTGIS